MAASTLLLANFSSFLTITDEVFLSVWTDAAFLGRKEREDGGNAAVLHGVGMEAS